VAVSGRGVKAIATNGKEPNAMAYYEYANYLDHVSNPAFDVDTHPSNPTPYSGIYRCMGCGHECVSTAGHPMPPQNHHQHTYAQGAIRWRLIVMATHV
jgi:hypothetical protein